LNKAARQGNLIIVSGPSGSGKSTVAASVLASIPDLAFSISYTTRAPRGSERNGVEYHFVGQDRFEQLLRADELLECATVYGNYYGTSKGLVNEALARGTDVLLDVDVQGARTIRLKRPDAVSVFILPPSCMTLRRRLEQRALDKHYEIEQRLQIACEEVAHYVCYDYLIINDELDTAIDELKAIILASRCRISSRAESARSVLSTFGGTDGQYPG
jgi:guanylate kinase